MWDNGKQKRLKYEYYKIYEYRNTSGEMASQNLTEKEKKKKKDGRKREKALH